MDMDMDMDMDIVKDHMDMDMDMDMDNGKPMDIENNMDNGKPMDNDRDNIMHFFLWVSHGGNVSAINNLYPVKTEFQSIIMYSRPFNNTTLNEIKQLEKDPCDMILGSCPYIPIQPHLNSNYVYLPPILFYVSPDEPNNDIINYSGLYYMQLTNDILNKENISSNIGMRCKRSHTIKIYDHNQLIDQRVRYNRSNNIYTYSIIFQLVKDYCKGVGLDTSQVLLGLFSCQDQITKYTDPYIKNITNLIPRTVYDRLIIPKIYSRTGDNRLDTVNMNYFSNTIIELSKPPERWEALGQIKHQGCALNVLSYFGVIDEKQSREQVVCLSLDGTSIFKIIDILNTYLINVKNIKNNIGFFVTRVSFRTGVKTLINFMKTVTLKNYFIIFKMLNTDKRNGKDNHRGHTVAFYKQNEKYMYVDPQLDAITRDLDQYINQPDYDNLIASVINQNYNNQWNFMDIIYTIRTEPFIGREYKRIDTISVDTNIIERTPDIIYGGNGLHKYSKKTFLKKSQKKTKYNSKNKRIKNKQTKMNKLKNKRRINKKTLKRNKHKKYYGGVVPIDFNLLMSEIDKDNNIQTVAKL